MSLPGLLERGIEVVLRSSSAEDELRELVAKAGLEAEAAEHLRQTLEAIPSILVAITRDLSKGDPTIRSLFHAIVDYLIQEENLIPSHAGRPILGLLDDVYLVHVDMRSISGGAQLLEQVLPRGVITSLRSIVDDAIRSTRNPCD